MIRRKDIITREMAIRGETEYQKYRLIDRNGECREFDQIEVKLKPAPRESKS